FQDLRVCMVGAPLWQIANHSSIPTWMSLISRYTLLWRAARAQCLLWYRGCQNGVKDGMFSMQPIWSQAQTGPVSEQQTRLHQPRDDRGFSSGLRNWLAVRTARAAAWLWRLSSTWTPRE